MVVLVLILLAIGIVIHVRRQGLAPIEAEQQRAHDIKLEGSTLERLRQIALDYQQSGNAQAVSASITEMFTDGTPLPVYLKPDMDLAGLIEAIEARQAERAEELMLYVERAEQVGAVERN